MSERRTRTPTQGRPEAAARLVVCDGMGGAAGGQLASHAGVGDLSAELEKALKPDMTPEQLREASA